MTLNQLRCLPTTSHQIEQPAAVTIGHSYHGVSPQEVLHHHPPVMAGGLSFQLHDPSNTGQNYPQQTNTYGAESWHSGYFPHRYEVVTLPGNVKKSATVVALNLLTGTEVLRTTSWSRMSTGDLLGEMSAREIFFLEQITATHIIT